MSNRLLSKIEVLSLRATELRLHVNIARSQTELYLVKSYRHPDTSSELYMKDYRNHLKWQRKLESVEQKLQDVELQIQDYCQKNPLK